MSYFSKGFSAPLFIFSALLVLSLIIFAPMPHFRPDTGWYQGASIAAKALGEAEEGSPIEQVYWSVIKASVESPFSISCNSNLDCTSYTVLNQCKVYCSNNQEANRDVARQLDTNRVCDYGSWDKPTVDCKCVLGRCINTQD